MNFRLIPAVIIFLGSYLPLSVILLAQNFQYDDLAKSACNPLKSVNCELPISSPVATLTFAVTCFVCMMLTLLALRATKPKHKVEVKSFQYVPTDLMNYTLPYVVSFMNVDFSDFGDFVGFAVFLAWMFWITLRSGQILMNPVLIAFGWRHYNIEYTHEASPDLQSGACLSKDRLQVGSAKKIDAQSILIVSQQEK